jgi:hypothetical protein
MLKDEKITSREERKSGSNPDKQANYGQRRAFASAKNVTPIAIRVAFSCCLSG